MYSRKIFILTVFLLTSCILSSQEYEARLYLGANYYQGDLAPSSHRLSYSSGQASWASMVGMRVNEIFKVNAKFMTGKLVGRDAQSKDLSRKKRNLSFESPLYELGLNTEVNLNYFVPRINKFGVKIYYTTGVNIFHFSPKTFMRDEFGIVQIVDLQPLGTEGQGLPGYQDRYALTQINIPFGIGLSFHLFDNFELGLEFTPRFTFTDYLDDVSDAYMSYEELIAANRPIAAMLTNRTGEYLGTGIVSVPTGTQRGDPNDNDWYLFSGVYLSYNWGADYSPIKQSSKAKSAEELMLNSESGDSSEN